MNSKIIDDSELEVATPKKRKPRVSGETKPRSKIRKNTTVQIDGSAVKVDDIYKLIQNQDVKELANGINNDEVKNLVSSYYTIQDHRIRSHAQAEAFKKQNKPVEAVAQMDEFMYSLEQRIFNIMSEWTKRPDNKVAQWAVSQVGIGPVLAAGWIANIDVHKAKTAGAVLKYIGHDPNEQWITKEDKLKEIITETLNIQDQRVIDLTTVELICQRFNRSVSLTKGFLERKGYKDFNKISMEDMVKSLKICPYNQEMKTLAWKTWQSFNKVRNNQNAVYGHLFAKRQAYEQLKNDNFEYKDQADIGMKRVSKSTEAYKHYKEGKLPPGHILSRSGRFAVKIWVSHLHAIMWWNEFGTMPIRPFAMNILGHKDYIKIPQDEIVNFPQEYYDLGTVVHGLDLED